MVDIRLSAPNTSRRAGHKAGQPVGVTGGQTVNAPALARGTVVNLSEGMDPPLMS